MRTFVTVMCAVGLASGPEIVSHVPSDYEGKPYEDSVYKSDYKQGNNFAYFEFEHSQRE
jgi:hypothetical protein